MPEGGETTGEDVRSSTSDQAEPGGGVRRRTVLGVLLGTAAGGVAGGVAGAITGDRSGSGDGASAPAPSSADEISVEPTGELVAEDVQAALVDVVGRSSALARLDDLRVATEVVDDFIGGDGRLGVYGWSTVADGAGAQVASVADAEGGVVRVDAGSAGRAALHLGLSSDRGLAVFTMEWRVQVEGPGRLVVGAVGSVDGSGAEGLPDHGMYFVRDGSSPWRVVTGSAEGRTVTDTDVTADGDFHRLRITCDGAGIVRFSIDDDQVATSSDTLPAEDAYGPGLSVEGGTAAVDWYYGRRERPR